MPGAGRDDESFSSNFFSAMDDWVNIHAFWAPSGRRDSYELCWPHHCTSKSTWQPNHLKNEKSGPPIVRHWSRDNSLVGSTRATLQQALGLVSASQPVSALTLGFCFPVPHCTVCRKSVGSCDEGCWAIRPLDWSNMDLFWTSLDTKYVREGTHVDVTRRTNHV